jgi:hypothetical protein
MPLLLSGFEEALMRQVVANALRESGHAFADCRIDSVFGDTQPAYVR